MKIYKKKKKAPLLPPSYIHCYMMSDQAGEAKKQIFSWLFHSVFIVIRPFNFHSGLHCVSELHICEVFIENNISIEL